MPSKRQNAWAWLAQRASTMLLALALTVGLFLVLPLMQAIGSPVERDLGLRAVDLASLPPPPPEPEDQEIEEEKPPESPPKLELQPEAPPLDLAQLELALNPVAGEALFGDFTIRLVDQLGSEGGSEELDRVFSLSDLDQRPRVLFQRSPSYPAELRRRQRQGTVYVVFLVDRQGRVLDPKVEKSTDPAFEGAALEAVRQWKFEPGTRNGEKVQFKMRVPITFNASG
jgi:protein TonB